MVDINIWNNDRNLNIDEADSDRNLFIVAEHNDLITKARHDLNTQQLKMLDFVISKIKPTDEEFTTINTSMYKLSRILNIKRSDAPILKLPTVLMICVRKTYSSITKKNALLPWPDGSITLKFGKMGKLNFA